MITRLTSAGQTDSGKLREHNEDAFFQDAPQSSLLSEPIGLFVVADGIGGHEAGEVASRSAVEAVQSDLDDLFQRADPRATRKLSEKEIERLVSPDPGRTRKLEEAQSEDDVRQLEERVEQAVKRANQVVWNHTQKRPEAVGDMGSTITMALVKGSTAIVANVGDSRTYLLRNGELRRITKDHSVVESLVAAGQLQREEVYDHPQRNLIFRSLGGKPDVEVDLFRQELQPGDPWLRWSDGLWERVRDPQSAKIMGKAPAPSVACQRLVKAANDNGGEDNIAVVVVWAE